MPKFTIEKKERLLKFPNRQVLDITWELLNNDTGEKAVISQKGASLSELFLSLDGTEPVPVIFSYYDLAALEMGKNRIEFGQTVSEEIAKAAYIIKENNPSHAGGVVISPANRLLDGIIRSADGKKILHRFPILNQESLSILHGYAQYSSFLPKVMKCSIDSCAVTFRIPLNIKMEGFAPNAFAELTYTLSDNCFEYSGLIYTRDNKSFPVSFALHPSYLIGDYHLSEHRASLGVKGMLETDDKLNPTGSVIKSPWFNKTVFFAEPIDIDNTFILGEKQEFELMTVGDIGITVKSEGQISTATVWTNGSKRRFVAYEPIVGTHAAGLSRGGENPWQDPDEILEQRVVSAGNMAYFKVMITPQK